MTQKQEAAVAIRDAALAIVEAGGQTVEFKHGRKALMYKGQGFTILHCAIEGKTMLDLWPQGAGKVFSVRWTEDEFTIVNFKRGEWERAFTNEAEQTDIEAWRRRGHKVHVLNPWALNVPKQTKH